MSVAAPGAGTGVAEVACVRADMILKTGLRLAVAVRRNRRAAAIAICSERNKQRKSKSESLWLNEEKSLGSEVSLFFDGTEKATRSEKDNWEVEEREEKKSVGHRSTTRT